MAQERSGIAVGLNKGHVRSPFFFCLVQVDFEVWVFRGGPSKSSWGEMVYSCEKTVYEQ